MLALFGAHHILHVRRIRVNERLLLQFSLQTKTVIRRPGKNVKMRRDLEIMVNVRGEYYDVCYADPNCNDLKNLGISFFRIRRHLSPDPNIVRLKWCRTVSDHSDDVTMFICMPRILPEWYYEVPGLED